jgi:hypothetical protein
MAARQIADDSRRFRQNIPLPESQYGSSHQSIVSTTHFPACPEPCRVQVAIPSLILAHGFYVVKAAARGFGNTDKAPLPRQFRAKREKQVGGLIAVHGIGLMEDCRLRVAPRNQEPGGPQM